MCGFFLALFYLYSSMQCNAPVNKVASVYGITDTWMFLWHILPEGLDAQRIFCKDLVVKKIAQRSDNKIVNPTPGRITINGCQQFLTGCLGGFATQALVVLLSFPLKVTEQRSSHQNCMIMVVGWNFIKNNTGDEFQSNNYMFFAKKMKLMSYIDINVGI